MPYQLYFQILPSGDRKNCQMLACLLLKESLQANNSHKSVVADVQKFGRRFYSHKNASGRWIHTSVGQGSKLS